MKLQWQKVSPKNELNIRLRPLVLLFLTWVFALSVTILLAYVFYLDPFPLWLGIVVSAVVLLLMEGLTRIPKISVPAFFIALLALTLSLLFSDTVQVRLQAYLQQFADTALLEVNEAWMWEGHAAYSEGTQAQVFFLLVLLFSVLSFFVVRLFRQSTVMMMILLLAAAQAEFQEIPKILIPTILGLFCVLFILGQAGDLSVKHLRLPLLRIVLAVIAAAILNHVLAPQVLYNEELSRMLKEAEESWNKKEKQSDYHEFNLDSAGYPAADTLGGPILLSEEPYAEVTAGAEALYLRGAVYSSYSGRGWTKEGMDRAEIFGSEQGLYLQDSAFYLNLTERSSLAVPTSYRVKPIFQPQQSILLAGQPLNITMSEKGLDERFYFNYSGSVYWGQSLPESGYQVEARAFNLGLENYDHLIAELWHASNGGHVLSEEERLFWTSLPASVDENLYLRFLEETQAFSRPEYALATAIEIKSRLSSELFRYELNVDVVPEGREFVDFFLEQKEGYCTYFATAMTVLCRQAGVPARYVEGYVLPAGSLAGESTRILTGKQAHAWTEIWIDGVGWLPLDATPADYQQRLGASEEEKEPESSESKPEPEETSPTTTLPTEPKPEDEEDRPPEPFNFASLLPYLFVLLIASALLAVYQWRKKDLLRRHQLDWQMAEAGGDSGIVVQRVWTDMKKLAALHDLEQKSGQSVKQYLLSWPEDLYLQDTPRILEQAMYGPQKPGEEELILLFEEYRRLEELSKAQIPPLRWYTKRFLGIF